MPNNKDKMTAESLAKWIASAEVDQYTKNNKEVYIATTGNEQLILTCHRVEYPHGLHPHINIVYINDDTSELLYQDQITHSIGNLDGEHCVRENVETVWVALLLRHRELTH